MAGPATTYKLFDGAKAVPLESLPPEAWTFLTGGSPDGSKVKKLYDVVPWLFRGINLRATSLAAIPFSIFRGDEEIDSSDDWRNEVGFLPDPFELLYLTEGDLTVHGRSYWFRGRNLVKTLELRRLQPTTVKPKFDVEQGLVGYTRVLQQDGVPREFTPDDMAYFRVPNLWGEVGHGRSAAEAALNSAGVLMSVDQFAQAYFERGAVKATLLSVEGTPKPQERRRLVSWWRKVAAGIDNAFGSDVVSAKVTPVVIGEGLESLSDQNLTKEKREDISTALGIPQSILFSTGSVNRAVMQEDDRHFYTKTLVPEALMIERQANHTIFNPEGYRLKFRPQEMSIFREDEEERSVALMNLINAGIPLEAALDILGFDLSKEAMEAIKKEIAEKERRREEMAQRLSRGGDTQPPPPGMAGREDEGTEQPPQDEKLLADLQRWRRKSLKAIKKGGSAQVPFESKYIPARLHGAIEGALEGASASDVRLIFSDAISWREYP